MDVSKINLGDTIGYHLAPNRKPTDPMKVWHGRVKQIFNTLHMVRVECTDEGFEGEIEEVEAQYIVEHTPLQ